MFNQEISVGNHKISRKSPVFIIAEVGVNHNGDVNLATKMIKEAARCGADCVKFQTFKAERVALRDAPKAEYQLKVTDSKESQIDMLRSLELPFDDYKKIIDCCHQEGVVFMSTPYNVEDVDYLDELGVSAYKLASIHAVEPWFARYTAKKGKPIILSTGMATLAELDETVRAIHEVGNKDLVLLQCTTNYPSRLVDTNLRAMQTMTESYDVLVGYSDHTQNDVASIVSIGLGATVIEKHFTIDKSLSGPDQSTSADAEEFSTLVQKIRSAELVLGSSLKEPCDIEKKNSVGMRRSIVSKRDIKKGTVITEDMLTFKRPLTGLSPIYMDRLLGKEAKENISKDSFIEWAHIGE
jgi:N,N'-diacetyllegionaminate synthase